MFATLSFATTAFTENFDDGISRWTHTSVADFNGQFKHSHGKFFADAKYSLGLQTSQDSRFYGISSQFAQPFNSQQNDLVLQLSVKHEQNLDCGGGYIKLLPKTASAEFKGDSLYYVMFGPDMCGYSKKIHLIFNYKGKNLLWKKEPTFEADELTHFYTLIVKAKEGTYEVLVDGALKESGSLDTDWDFLPPKEIDDPTDKKPSDWVEEPEIDDPKDIKPADWDSQPETIADPDAKQPDDWDTEEDGTWEPPQVPNPNYKGAWKAKRIPNPAYKGVWKAKQIPNPAFAPDNTIGRYTDIATAGFDLWQVKSGSIFDNILVTDSPAEAEAARKEWDSKYKQAEKDAKDAQAKDASKASSSPSDDEDDEE